MASGSSSRLSGGWRTRGKAEVYDQTNRASHPLASIYDATKSVYCDGQCRAGGVVKENASFNSMAVVHVSC